MNDFELNKTSHWLGSSRRLSPLELFQTEEQGPQWRPDLSRIVVAGGSLHIEVEEDSHRIEVEEDSHCTEVVEDSRRTEMVEDSSHTVHS